MTTELGCSLPILTDRLVYSESPVATMEEPHAVSCNNDYVNIYFPPTVNKFVIMIIVHYITPYH